ncbi:MAG: NAD(P)H-binding protein [Chloroflexales bacterium]|nr:NAD(P)H-binding protein [Chloroflexales bacterium]
MPSSPDRILVIGATGMLGKPVAERLHAEGFAVRALARSPERARNLLPAGVEIVQGDVAEPDTLARALDGCAGVHINLKGGPDEASYERVEHQGTRAVAQAARTAGIRQLTYLSAYTITAQTATSPEARAKWRAEEAIRASGVPATIFRATWFMESLPLFIRGRTATVIGRQPHRLHWLAAADYARMVARSYQTPAALGKELYLYGLEALTMREALQRYCAALAPKARVLTIPVALSAGLARATGDAELRSITTLLAYYNRHGETGDPATARAVCGPPKLTLDQWCRQRAQEQGITSARLAVG